MCHFVSCGLDASLSVLRTIIKIEKPDLSDRRSLSPGENATISPSIRPAKYVYA